MTLLLVIFTAHVSFSQPVKTDTSDYHICHIYIPVTSAVSEVKAEDFNKGYIYDPFQLIEGKVAGFSISKAGSNLNSGFETRLRGLTTINGKSTPLIIIDGVRDVSLENLDPNDIATITILKDGSATAIYGSVSAGGVILIRTVRGDRNKPRIEYNTYTSTEKVAKNIPVMSPSEWRKLSEETGLGTDYLSNTDWFNEIERTALSQSHNISMSGGSDKTNYRASINYRKAEGILKGTGYSKLNGRINISQKALNDRLTFDLNLAATEKDSEYGFNEAFHYAAIYNPTSAVRSSDPLYSKFDGFVQQNQFDYYNPVSIIELNQNEGKNRILNYSLKADFEILKGLNVDVLYSSQMMSSLGDKYFDRNDLWGGYNTHGLAARSQDNSSIGLIESTINYARTIRSVVNLNILAGYSGQKFTNEGFYAQGGNFLTDNFSFNNLQAAMDFTHGKGSASSYRNKSQENVFFGIINADFGKTVYLSAGARYEGFSGFSSSNKWNVYPSFGAALDLSRLANIKFANNLLLRVDYSSSGNRPLNSLHTDLNLKRETRTQIDAGLEFSVFNSRLTGSFDYYSSNTTDLLYLINVPVSPNLNNQILANTGELKSSGMELSAVAKLINKTNFSYRITLATSYIFNNTFESLSGFGIQVVTQDLGKMGSPGQNQVPLVRIEAGKPVGQLTALVFNGIDANGFPSYVDQNRNGFIDQSDMQVVGNGLPKLIIGLGNDIIYKNWDLNIFGRGVFGHDLVNCFRALYEAPDLISLYNLPVTATDLRNPANKSLSRQTSGTFTDMDVESGTFISLHNLSLGYSFYFNKTTSFNKIRLYLAGNNLCYLTKYKGSDPNPRYADSATDPGTFNNPLVPGIDRVNTWPRTRSMTVGANFVF